MNRLVKLRLYLRFNLDKSVKYLIFTISLCLCLYQICKICEMYFSYKTIITFGFVNQSVISLPAITFCIQKDLILREEVLKKIFNVSDIHMIDSLRKYKQVLLHLNNKTIGEQYSLMYGKDHVFNQSCRVSRPSSFHSKS